MKPSKKALTKISTGKNKPGRSSKTTKNNKEAYPPNDDKLIKRTQVFLNKEIGQIETGLLEVSLALTAICAVLASNIINFLTIEKTGIFILALLATFIACAAFILSTYASGRLFFSYLIVKFPRIYIEVQASQLGFLGLIKYYLALIIKAARGIKTQGNETEFAYLSILGAFTLTWLATAAWIALSVGSSIASYLAK